MTNMILNRNETFWEEKSAWDTAHEISGQPRLWRVLADELTERKDEIVSFMKQFKDRKDLRIAYTGAGSSAFIGESIQKILASELRLDSVTIHSPDVISDPEGELFDVPTLLVSYARSGESPESVGAIRKAQEYVHDLYNLVIVCKKDSSLDTYGRSLDKTLVLVMPEGSSDKGFAMTSSVSCMMLATYVVFGYEDFDERVAFLRDLADQAERQMDEFDRQVMKVAAFDYKRCVFLGLGGLKGLAHEGSIKTMELTNGEVATNYEGSTGFRHGPKTIIDSESLTVHLISDRPYTRIYDMDLLKEINNERKGNRTLAVVNRLYKEETSGTDYVITYESEAGKYTEMANYIFCLLVLQLLSLEKSIALGYTTDSPCAGGEVNRVVKGVIIY